MSNHQTHLDAAKQVCLTALHHLEHGCVVAVKQHSGSVVDEPGEAARIILTLELEALDLPATNNDHQNEWTDIPPIYLEGYLLEMAKRRVMDDVMGAKPIFMGGRPMPEEAFARRDDLGKNFGPKPITEDWFKDGGRAGRLATGEDSGGESLHVVKDSEGEGGMVMGPLEFGVVKVPALTRENLTTIVYSAGLGLLTSKLDAMIDKIMEAQHNARWGDE